MVDPHRQMRYSNAGQRPTRRSVRHPHSVHSRPQSHRRGHENGGGSECCMLFKERAEEKRVQRDRLPTLDY